MQTRAPAAQRLLFVVALAGLAAFTATGSRAESLPDNAAAPPPLCQAIRGWLASEPAAANGPSEAVATALLGARFTQAFGKPYMQLSATDLRSLQDQGMAPCIRSRVLERGLMLTANTLLNPGYQARWTKTHNGSAPEAAAPRRALAQYPAAPTANAVTQPSTALLAQPSASALPAAAVGTRQPAAAAPPPAATAGPGLTTPTTTAAPSAKAMGSDLKASLFGALGGVASTALSSGTQALQGAAERIGKPAAAPEAGAPAAATAAAPAPAKACPSEADMQIIKRAGATPPPGCER